MAKRESLPDAGDFECKPHAQPAALQAYREKCQRLFVSPLQSVEIELGKAEIVLRNWGCTAQQGVAIGAAQFPRTL